jgi:hypothetical protein
VPPSCATVMAADGFRTGFKIAAQHPSGYSYVRHRR